MQDIADCIVTAVHAQSMVPWMTACYDFSLAVGSWTPDHSLARVTDTYGRLRAYSQICLRRELRMAEILALAVGDRDWTWVPVGHVPGPRPPTPFDRSDRDHEDESDVVICGHHGYLRKDVLEELFPGRVQLVPISGADGECLVIRKQPMD
ncbi:hypothetical protein AB1Y20_016067 [Prymnesium parvum]|uniref:Uncharacterized protein n=1 Tax=Prymnesium parvum TaxID=97485 RepID=A0AB34JYH8_PRYPA